MLAGNYAVVSDIPTSRFITNNYECAGSFPVDDVDTLAKQLVAACQMPEEQLEAFARMGYESIKCNMALDRICALIEKGLSSSADQI